jgi:hypothetical protein
VQVFDAICINISEIVQAIAAMMVTVGAPQCTTRAKSKRAHPRQFDGRGCAIMVIWNPGVPPHVSV